MGSTNRASEIARIQSLIAGIGKRFSNVPQLTFGGVTYTPQALGQLFTSFVKVLTDVDVARANLKSKLVVQRAQVPLLRAVVSAFVAFVRVTLGNQPDALADFDLLPKKARTPLTVEEKAKRVGKALATRTARHTMGPKKKAAIKGQVPATATSGGSVQPANPPPAPKA